jgi:hypothetical protein
MSAAPANHAWPRIPVISPELALVDPDLAEEARALLRDPGSILPSWSAPAASPTRPVPSAAPRGTAHVADRTLTGPLARSRRPRLLTRGRVGVVALAAAFLVGVHSDVYGTSSTAQTAPHAPLGET